MADPIQDADGGGRTVRYRAPGPGVVSQEFNDETIIVHLDSGIYYSLNPPASAVWRLACAGHTLQETVDACNGFAAEAGDGIASVWGKIVTAGLVRRAESGAEPPAVQPVVALDSQPRIVEYADMQDLFQLDPVHDVDENGWPSTQPLPPSRV